MNRRTFLRSVGLGGLAGTAGCTSPFASHDDIGAIAISPAKYETDSSAYYSDETFSVKGRIVRKSSTTTVVDDGTGVAELGSRETGTVLDTDALAVGGCVSGSGPLAFPESTQNGMPFIALESGGKSNGCPSAEPLEAPPDAEFRKGAAAGGDASMVRYEGGGAVLSRSVVVRWRARGRDTPWTTVSSARWDERTGVPADEAIPEGSSMRWDRGSLEFSILWTDPDGDRGWSRQL